MRLGPIFDGISRTAKYLARHWRYSVPIGWMLIGWFSGVVWWYSAASGLILGYLILVKCPPAPPTTPPRTP